MTESTAKKRLRILSMVEATSINAVAKNVLEFHNTARQLAESSTDFPVVEGCIVTFDRTSDTQETPTEFVAAARNLGLEVDVIPERRRFDLKVIPALRQTVESRAPDIIVTHAVKSHFLLWRSRVWKQFPWIAFHHGYTTTDRKMRLMNRFDRWSLPAADRVLTVCQAFARDLAGRISMPVEDIAVQHNSIRPGLPASADKVQALRAQLGLSDDERVLLSIGRLSREKAHGDLLAAFHRALQSKPGIRCRVIIVGEGPERENLRAITASLALQDRVIFAGPTRDVQPFYGLADAVVISSHSEGSSNVLLEAMAANRPVIATAVGGVPEMVEDNESALLVPAADPPTMGAAIIRLLEDDELAMRLATNASRLAAERYSPENYARSLIEFYGSASRSREPRRGVT
jgi:glycosyltransferase involved in cell wall biosynthesis